MIMTDPAGHGIFGAGAEVIHPRTEQRVEPRFLDRQLLPAHRRQDPRRELADWMTSPQNPYFAEAAVNRIWGYFFSRGIVEPVDDFRSTNPPTHPLLLRSLAADFATHGYDLKRLIRLIVQSRCYQLRGTVNESNRSDRTNYSRFLPKELDAEVLLDAIRQVVEGRLDYFNGTRAINWLRTGKEQFLKVYGQPDRLTIPERSMAPSLAQALHQLAGSTYTTSLSEGGRVVRMLQGSATDSEIVDELYLAALSRLPAKTEKMRLLRLIHSQSDRRQSIEDLLWALITSEEFIYNH